jgi:hypothetical protein
MPRAISDLEKATTNLLKSRYSRPRICAQLSELLTAESEQDTEDRIGEIPDKDSFLEDWMAKIFPGLTMDPPLIGNNGRQKQKRTTVSRMGRKTPTDSTFYYMLQKWRSFY